MTIIIEPISVTVNFGDNDEFDCSFTESDSFDVDFGMDIPQHEYPGPYEVTPSSELQELNTVNQQMTQNVVINPIPNNYGLITYDGSIITVS